MEFRFIDELLRLLFYHYQGKPHLFVDFFNNTTSIIAFVYSCSQNKFTHVNNSFNNTLGCNLRNVLLKGVIPINLIHPQDQKDYCDYFNILKDDRYDSQHKPDKNPVKRLKCRLQNSNGYWCRFVFFSLNFKSNTESVLNKIGIIADEGIRPNHEIPSSIDNYIDLIITAEKIDCKKPRQNNKNERPITNRESEILELIGKGLIAKEIACKLNISTSTVVTHKKNLILKLDAKNTAELVNKAGHLMLI